MRSTLLQMTLLAVPLAILIPAGMIGAGAAARLQASPADDQSYAGKWVGTYATQNGESEKVVFALTKDADGGWHGTVTYTNEDGDQTAELKSLRIEGTKFKAKIDSPNGAEEVTLEGEFSGTRFEGTYSVSEKGSTDVLNKGTWKTTKSPSAAEK